MIKIQGEIPNIKNDFSDFFIVMGQTRPKSKLGQDQPKMKLNQNRPKINQAKISSRGKKKILQGWTQPNHVSYTETNSWLLCRAQ